MKHLSKLKCWLIGHNPYYLEFSPHECMRCQEDLSYHEITKPGLLSEVENYFLTHWKTMDYFRKCQDCGLRFGKHNILIDHVPF